MPAAAFRPEARRPRIPPGWARTAKWGYMDTLTRIRAFIDVVDTTWAAKTDANGDASFRGVPPTGVTIDVWHPYLRAPGNRISRAAALAPGPARRESFTAALRSPPRPPDAAY